MIKKGSKARSPGGSGAAASIHHRRSALAMDSEEETHNWPALARVLAEAPFAATAPSKPDDDWLVGGGRKWIRFQSAPLGQLWRPPAANPSSSRSPARPRSKPKVGQLPGAASKTMGGQEWLTLSSGLHLSPRRRANQMQAAILNKLSRSPWIERARAELRARTWRPRRRKSISSPARQSYLAEAALSIVCRRAELCGALAWTGREGHCCCARVSSAGERGRPAGNARLARGSKWLVLRVQPGSVEPNQTKPDSARLGAKISARERASEAKPMIEWLQQWLPPFQLSATNTNSNDRAPPLPAKLASPQGEPRRARAARPARCGQASGHSPAARTGAEPARSAILFNGFISRPPRPGPI